MRTIITLTLLAETIAAHEHVRRHHGLEGVVANLVTRMEEMERELKDLREHRKLDNDLCDLVFEADGNNDGSCWLRRKLIIDTNITTTALEARGDVFITAELDVIGDATFEEDVFFPGEDNDIEIEGKLWAHGDLEVCGFTTLHSDVTIEPMPTSGSSAEDHEDLDGFPGHGVESVSSDDPILIVKGDILVESGDVTIEEELDVEGDVSLSEDLTIGGDCDGCSDDPVEPEDDDEDVAPAGTGGGATRMRM